MSNYLQVIDHVHNNFNKLLLSLTVLSNLASYLNIFFLSVFYTFTKRLDLKPLIIVLIKAIKTLIIKVSSMQCYM